MTTTDDALGRLLAARYALAVEMLETSMHPNGIDRARTTLASVKEQSQALWDAIMGAGLNYDAHERRVAAEASGLLRLLTELKGLDLDSLFMFLPNTTTFEQRGVPQ